LKTDAAVTRPRRYTQSARADAAAATARRIVDAFLARLMTQWYDEITLDRIAEDSGVTVQTVIRRFGSKDGLLAEAVKTLGAQINARRGMPAGDLGRLVGNLMEDYEATGDGVIRLLALEPRHPALQAVLDYGRQLHRVWVAAVFAEPLQNLDAAARRRAVDALVIVTDVYAWKLLRRDMGRSPAAAAATMRGLIQATIDPFLQPSPGDRR
jgi:AcrR family transcriptional regulator